MDKRTARQRREYLYRKNLEATANTIYERKQKLKTALDEGRAIPSDLKAVSAELSKDLAFDEAQKKPGTHVDDEYATVGIKDPKILITTSRDPSSRLQQFAKEMRLMFPNAQRMNRGGHVMSEIVAACRANEATDLIIVHEHRGQPDGMIISHFPHGPTAYFSLHNVVLRHDIPDRGTVSEQFPHLIFSGFSSNLGARVTSILQALFPVPKEEAKRVMTFANEGDFISYRHHVFLQVMGQVQLAEVGPRFEMKLYEIKLGMVDEGASADTEWVFRPYHRTAKKRAFL